MAWIDQFMDNSTNSSKANVQLTGLGPREIAFLNDTVGTPNGRGASGGYLVEPRAKYISSQCELTFPFGVFGRDRPGSRRSGYGETGDTQSQMLDLVVGRLGSDMRAYDETTGQRLYVDPDLQRDAARIYMSQKTDAYQNFRLNAPGNPIARSSIILKADTSNLIGREGCNIVTGTDPKNSQGGKIRSVPAINLIAGNSKKELQALVKGGNLVKFLTTLIEKLSRLAGTLMNYMNYQVQFNMGVMNHYHISPFFGQQTTPDVAILPMQGMPQIVKMITNSIGSLATYKMNLKAMSNNYLKPSGKRYINSRYNRSN